MRLGLMVVALATGALSVAAFSPFGLFPLAFVSLAAFVWLLDRRAHTARFGFALGFAWGFGAFAVGVSWLFVALNRYGGMPASLAALSIGLFCAYLALYPALLGAVYARWKGGGAFARAAFFAGLWIVAELLRGWVFTGFPWLSIGYTQTPPSPLSGWQPVLGVYGVGGLVAFLGALLVLLPWRSPQRAMRGVLVAAVCLVAGGLLGRVAWTDPVGAPLNVALLQTNVAQELKWKPDHVDTWLTLNAEMADIDDADVVVLPETTLPMLSEHLPEGYLESLDARARERGSTLLAGVFVREESNQIFNALISLGEADGQRYAKRHLVPFGEYSPAFFDWFYAWADIPMSNQTPGPAGQAPITLNGHRIAVNICYEDVFGRELLYALPEATLMLNVSNLAWYGNSFAQPQHLQIAQVRALETGRPMLRSTNTGMTAVIQPDGEVKAVLPQFERGVLQAEIIGHVGMTPYARWGDAAALVLAALGILFAQVVRRRN